MALRDRFARAGVCSNIYKLNTVDAFAIRVVLAYPQRTGLTFDLAGTPPYKTIRNTAAKLIYSGALDEILKATYQRALVDEYQDCSVQQHNVVNVLARLLPTCVFGDPLQAIFGFGDDPLPGWSRVEAEYPALDELTTPWRWNNLGANDLGEWVLSVRKAPLEGRPIDLRTGGPRVHWRQLTGDPAKDIAAQVSEQYRVERIQKTSF